MAKTKIDIVSAALRYLAVISADEPAQAEDLQYASDILEALRADMFNAQGINVGDINSLPDDQFIPMYKLLASEIAPFYSQNGGSRAMAVAALRQAVINTPAEIETTGDYF